MTAPRIYYLLLALACGGLLAFAIFYLEGTLGLEACPLCILQRIAYIAIIFVAVIACIHDPQGLGLRIYSGLILISALIGAGIAARQVWLQHLPADQVPECGPDLAYMLEVFPLAETLKMVFTGTGECAEVQWNFLTLSIAEWSLVCFAILVIFSLVHIFIGKNWRGSFGLDRPQIP